MPPKLQTLRPGPNDAGTSLQNFLKTRLNLSGRQTKTLIDSRNVFINGQRVWMARHPVKPGDVITTPARALPPAAALPDTLPILWQDNWILAVSKPPGLISESHDASLESRLRLQLRQPGLRALHRLDKDTSGLILFAKDGTDRDPYIRLFRDKLLQKDYLAIVRGVPPENRFSIDSRLDNKEAVTHIRVLHRTRTHALIRCTIPTGRTHQIRRHLLQHDLIITGERQYGQSTATVLPVERAIPRQMLHAASLAFPCPHTQKKTSLTAPIPPDMQETLTRLKLLAPPDSKA